MCGFVGSIGIVDERFKSKSIESIKHRGPDDSGCWDNEYIFLGHTRLSILDITENGHQPMVSDDGNYKIVFNGEIYNHWEIRTTLKNKNFNSSSDTETLLYAMIEMGVGVLNELRGIFSFVFYNMVDNTVIICRDQFGVKPLYYYEQNNSIYVGSEIKSFLTINNFSSSINTEALQNYLTYLYSPGEMTPFKNVKKVLPGHYIELKLQKGLILSKEIVNYYKLPFKGVLLDHTEEQFIDLVDEALTLSVKRQLISDVPIGFFLSGGLDSSILVAIARKLNPDRKIICFTIDTSEMHGEDDFTNDYFYAQKVAEYLDVELVSVKGDFDILKDFDHMIYSLDEPQADPAALHVYNICKKAKEMGIKVLLGGTGGDDIFSGYRRHQAIKVQKLVGKLPIFIRKLVKILFKVIPINNTLFRRLKKLTSSLDKSLIDRLASSYCWQDSSVIEKLFKPEVKKDIDLNSPVHHLITSLERIPDEKELLNKMLFWEMISFLPDHNLNYTDKMSMANGVEVRVPFLDLDLVELTTKIPAKFKMKGTSTKYILKKVAERYLPKDIIYRKKTGFGGPVRDWVKHDLREKMIKAFNNEQSTFSNLFDINEIDKLICKNDNNIIDASYTLFSLYAINSWIKQFVDCQEKVKSSEELT